MPPLPSPAKKLRRLSSTNGRVARRTHVDSTRELAHRLLNWRQLLRLLHTGMVNMKTVAVIGASSNRRKFGNIAVRAFRQAGYRVIPITPAATEVEGLRAYASVLEVPEPIDLATMYVPPAIGEQVLEQLAQKGILE